MATTALHPHTASSSTIEHITSIVCAMRPDWDEHRVATILIAHRSEVHAGDLAVAAIRAAANPDFREPRTIMWRGPHWDGAKTKPIDQTPKARCGVCGKLEPQCLTVRPGPDDHTFEPVQRG